MGVQSNSRSLTGSDSELQSIMLSAAFYTSVKSYDPYDFLWGTCVIWAKKNYLKAMNFDVKTKFCVKHRDLFVKCTEMNL